MKKNGRRKTVNKSAKNKKDKVRGGLKMKDKRMGKTGEVKEKAKRRQRW